MCPPPPTQDCWHGSSASACRSRIAPPDTRARQVSPTAALRAGSRHQHANELGQRRISSWLVLAVSRLSKARETLQVNLFEGTNVTLPGEALDWSVEARGPRVRLLGAGDYRGWSWEFPRYRPPCRRAREAVRKPRLFT